MESRLCPQWSLSAKMCYLYKSQCIPLFSTATTAIIIISDDLGVIASAWHSWVRTVTNGDYRVLDTYYVTDKSMQFKLCILCIWVCYVFTLSKLSVYTYKLLLDNMYTYSYLIIIMKPSYKSSWAEFTTYFLRESNLKLRGLV